MARGGDGRGHRGQAAGTLPRYRWHLGCILLKMPAVSLRTGGAIRSDVVRGLAAQHGVTPEVIFFRFVMGQGMIPLTVRAQLSS